jgi:FKBP-type peptidyl-prolyl cis-trans isomerase
MKKSMLVMTCGLLSGAAMMVVGCSQGDQSAVKTDQSTTNTPAAPSAAEVSTLKPVGPSATQPAAVSVPVANPQPRITASGLGIIEVAEGNGPVAKAGDNVAVNYTGKLADGTKFDSSYDRNEPIQFPLGAGHVIKGWDEGIAGMKVGGKRKLIIPPDLGYGATGTPGGPIPPNATLYFDVELMAIN